jgi:hypothetical protein
LHGKEPTLVLREVPGGWGDMCIDVRGVAAGPFDPAIWQHNTLNLVPHAGGQATLIEVRPGRYRNTYAPSVVEIADGIWRVYFAGWDGSERPNDQVYSVETRDNFISFGNRHTVIAHGPFQHVCNVNVTPAVTAGGFAMMCTAFPDAGGRNKPVAFHSRDGLRWNGVPGGGPYAAVRDDIVRLVGYDRYADADINGVNVLLFESGTFRMYFTDLRNGGKIYRASGGDGRRFKLDGVAAESPLLVNDVKKFRTLAGRDWYLMGLHTNGNKLFFSVSDDGAKFPEPQTLCTNVSDSADRYIVSIGWVTQGGQDERGRRLLGFFYGAGPAGSLDANRMFARWLQKKLVLTFRDKRPQPQTWSLGPDRQLIFIDKPVRAHVELLAEDGTTPIARTAGEIELKPNRAYQVTIDPAGPAGAERSR